MLLGNNHCVSLRTRVDVEEGDNALVFEDNLGFRLVLRDLTKRAHVVCHSYFHLCRSVSIFKASFIRMIYAISDMSENGANPYEAIPFNRDLEGSLKHMDETQEERIKASEEFDKRFGIDSVKQLSRENRFARVRTSRPEPEEVAECLEKYLDEMLKVIDKSEKILDDSAKPVSYKKLFTPFGGYGEVKA